MSFLGTILLVVGFVVIVRALDMAGTGQAVIKEANDALAVVRSRTICDDDKEAAMKATTRRLFGHFFSLAFGSVLALLAPVGVVWVGSHVGIFDFNAVIDSSFAPLFLVASGTFACVALLWKPKPQSADNTSDYSATERLLHRIAFNTTTAQLGLADIEDRVFARKLNNYSVERPVFVTGLPRAGTTLLLECLARMPEFAAHCYRDMPFVLTPMLWSQFSSAFHKTGTRRERAHSDGMTIDFDSPEALEEVVWQAFWQKHYRDDRIEPWGKTADREFSLFFRSHLRKIVALRRPTNLHGVRYVSKNNLNIARLPLIRSIFPDATIIIPFRHPLDHAASLLQQHCNFSALHKSDPFAADYMRALGHYDFGVNLRPINFDNWLQKDGNDANTLTFWLQYWVATYRHLLQNNGAAHFLCYETLCSEPAHTLNDLARLLHCRDADKLRSAANDIRAPRPHRIDRSAISATLIDETEALYDQLCESGYATTRQVTPSVSTPSAAI